VYFALIFVSQRMTLEKSSRGTPHATRRVTFWHASSHFFLDFQKKDRTLKMQDSDKTEVLTGEELIAELNSRFSKLPTYNPEDLDSVFSRAECYASTVRLAEVADFERWVKREYYKSSPEYCVAPLQDPPIPNGMVDCFRRLDEILVPKDRSSVLSTNQLKQVG
jgi:hypothetical protein